MLVCDVILEGFLINSKRHVDGQGQASQGALHREQLCSPAGAQHSLITELPGRPSMRLWASCVPPVGNLNIPST